MVTSPQHSWYLVCTGNICRSAFAEAYLRHAMGGTARVSSGGTGVNQALVPTEEIRAIATRHGLSLEEHRPKAIETDSLKEYDIVLTATVAQRGQILSEVPSLLNRAFTIKEFALLLPQIDLDAITEIDASKWWRSVARKASQLRSRVNKPECDLDISDPFRQEMSVYEKSTQEIIYALDLVVDAEMRRHLLA